MDKYKKYVLLMVAIVFLIACSMRIINLEIIKTNPYFNSPIMDERYHDEQAIEIAKGDVFSQAPYYRAPLYIYFLGMIYKLLGHNYFIARLIGIIIGSLSCVLIFLMTKDLFSNTIGLIAGFLACFYSMFMYYDSMLLTVYLEIFFSLLGMFFITKWLKDESKGAIILAGLCWGLAAITRPNFLVFPPFFIAYVFLFIKKPMVGKLRVGGLFLAGMVPLILAIFFINLFIGKDSVLIAWNGGINFFLGNNQRSNGWTATSLEIDGTWWGGYRDAITVAKNETGHELKPSQISDYWFKRGVKDILSNPFRWLLLMIKKVYLFCNTAEISNNQSIESFRQFSPLLRIPLINFGFILALGIWGMIASLKNKPSKVLIIFVITYSFSTIIFFITARYRMPVIPFLMIFAAATIYDIFEQFKKRKYKALLLPIAIIVIVFSLSNTKFYQGEYSNRWQIHISLGNRYLEKGNHREAIKEFKLALANNPHKTDAFNALGSAYMAANQHQQAITMFRQSLMIKSTIDALTKMGIIFSMYGVTDSAEYYLKAAVVQDSTHPQAYYYLGMHYVKNLQSLLAIQNLETCLKYYPEPRYLKNIYFNLGRLYFTVGDKKTARQYLTKAGAKPADIDELLEKNKKQQ